MGFFTSNWSQFSQVKLHLKATKFQLKEWEALLNIPTGSLSTYSSIAFHIHHPKAARAVGAAISSNPLNFLIPCHRVIKSPGLFGGYMWARSEKYL